MNIERRGESAPQSEEIEENPLKEAETAETAEPKEKFKGEDAEVTVKRSSGELEGGWEVLGPDKEKEGYVIVFNREQNKYKLYKKEDLLKLQPFQKGESVPVMRNDGKVDREGWVISESFGYGLYQVEKTIEGELKTELLRKSNLIDAKIAALELERKSITGWNDITSDDRKILDRIDRDLKYWQDKLKTATRLGKEFAVERLGKQPSQGE
jgi:hypothetical protein